jgi:hypothetical protein
MFSNSWHTFSESLLSYYTYLFSFDICLLHIKSCFSEINPATDTAPYTVRN